MQKTSISTHQMRVFRSTPGLLVDLRTLDYSEHFPPCPVCEDRFGGPESAIHKVGSYVRCSDSKIVQRLRCQRCRIGFSAASGSPFKWAKRRDLYSKIFEASCSNTSQRRTALKLGTSQKTVSDAVKKLGRVAMREHFDWLASQYQQSKIQEFQFDEMQTHQHTKMKPLAIPMAVTKDRKIIGFSVANMAYRAVHKERALKRYGPRKDRRKRGLHQMISCFSGFLAPQTTVWSDQELSYPLALEVAAPGVAFTHHREPSRRACIVGQGELKSGTKDPLFVINHTCAMVRANVGRLIRRTWNTTKKRMQLLRHLALYTRYHNMVLTAG